MWQGIGGQKGWNRQHSFNMTVFGGSCATASRWHDDSDQGWTGVALNAWSLPPWWGVFQAGCQRKQGIHQWGPDPLRAR